MREGRRQQDIIVFEEAAHTPRRGHQVIQRFGIVAGAKGLAQQSQRAGSRFEISKRHFAPGQARSPIDLVARLGRQHRQKRNGKGFAVDLWRGFYDLVPELFQQAHRRFQSLLAIGVHVVPQERVRR